MAFEERLSLLLSKVHEDYNEIVRNANFMDGDVEELAEKIMGAKLLMNHMESSFSECHSDVEALLFYDKPLTAILEQFHENQVSLWADLTPDLDGFLQETKRHITEVLEKWDALPMDEMKKAEDYRAMEQQIAEYHRENEERLLQRERWQNDYYENLEWDYSSCQEYLKRYEEIRGEPNNAFATLITVLYQRMKEFDSYTDAQLQAMSRLEDPLTSVYRYVVFITDKEPDIDTIDRVILAMANVRESFIAHNQKMQEQDNELER